MDSLRQKLKDQGLQDVIYMVINHQGVHAQRLHTMLAQRMTGNITLYKQDEQQPDVWQILKGEKDDFFIYDRCGRLTHHISLPYSIIDHGHVENAIKDTYCKRLCGHCAHESAEIPEECKQEAEIQPDANGAPAAEGDTRHGHGHHHGHHHGHEHGDRVGLRPRGFDHGHDHDHHHHHGNPDSQSQQGVGQQVFVQDSVLSQQAVHVHHMPQEAQGAPVMRRP